jgi:excisionase family DNA binding protein
VLKHAAEGAPQPTRASDADWIALQEASEQLGVAAATLRRWGDAGKLPMTRTLGGHRRFLRASVAELAATMHAGRAHGGGQPAAWGVNQREIVRQPWHHRPGTHPSTERMRELGQRLLGVLIQFINRQADDTRFLEEARDVGIHYGHEAHASGVSMHDTVEAFLFFRRSFSQLAMPLPGLAQPADLAEAATLNERIQRFMDTTLLGTISGYEQGMQSHRAGRM